MSHRASWPWLGWLLVSAACGTSAETSAGEGPADRSLVDPSQAGADDSDPHAAGASERCQGRCPLAGEDPTAYPLLGSSHGGSPLLDFCEGKADTTSLPPDPRTLVKPGVNKGKAVYYNAFWVDCHADPELVGEKAQPDTCGELRKRIAAGSVLMKQKDSAVGAGALFSGSDPFNDVAAGYGAASMPAKKFNRLWESWGLSERPDNFDELLGERYGAGFGTEPNPYPLPGEDPNETNGGSGRLPVFFVQLKTKTGEWSGNIGITCHGCHSGTVGSAEDGPGLGVIYGGGSSLHDFNLFLRDGLTLGYLPSLAFILNLTQNRGLSNASALNLAFLFPDEKFDVAATLGLLTSGSTAGMDTPAVWNLGHKTKKFVDGIFAADASRVDLVFYEPFLGLFGTVAGKVADKAQAWTQQHGQDVNAWFESVKAPAYPYPIDEKLAEQGAVLFHMKDLWASTLNNPVPKPEGGNGSCASCHGAYSPYFLHDPSYIDTPELEGIASFVVPKEVIRTDPVRVDTNGKAVQRTGDLNFFGYPETVGTEHDCGMQNRDRKKPGYYAPPLYGVWASSPYLHNGSVPNLWEVLKPQDRKNFWRRVSKPARADQAGKVIMGFDTDLERAFDDEKIGWKYEVLSCTKDDGLKPGKNCKPNSPDDYTRLQQILKLGFSNVIGLWNLLYPLPITMEQIEQRKIYNTRTFAMGNQGHDFTSVLTDRERTALIEYLKTL